MRKVAFTMRVLVVGGLLHNPAVEQAAEETGAELTFLLSRQAAQAEVPGRFDVLLAGLDHGDSTTLQGSPLLERCTLVVPIGAESIAARITSLPAEDVSALNEYFAYGGRENVRGGFRYLAHLLSPANRQKPPPPAPVPLDGIYTFSGGLYGSAEKFFQGEGRRFDRYVGILSYRSRWADCDLAVEQAIAESLERRGIGVIAAYTAGAPNEEMGTLTFRQTLLSFFCLEERPAVETLLCFPFLGARGENGEDIFQGAVRCFSGLDVPVVRPVGISGAEQDRSPLQPYAAEMPVNFVLPEMQGMVEPIHIFSTGEDKRRIPDLERVERLTGRMAGWLALRRKPNREKRVAVMLHNGPCAGVEATIGQAVDLDALESAAALLHRLQAEGYHVENIPADGKALRELIFQRKAFSDFRWTAAEDIAAQGGALCRMGVKEYLSYYSNLSPAVREQMEEHWGPPPGEAMVLDGELLITGIAFGNALVMVQPKRGCYGAKCTGEVCKILQDPACPPTHQFLATYWFLQRRWEADAVVHMGTHGSLEFLPGRACGMSRDCFSDIAIGDLINIYPYCASVVPQALTAKRRSYAVTIGYLPAPGRGLTPDQRRLAELIRRYFEAQEQESGQAAALAEEIRAAAQGSPAVWAALERETDFEAALREVRAMLAQADAVRPGGSARALGSVPDRQWVRDYIAAVWRSDSDADARWPQDPLERGAAMDAVIDAALAGEDGSPLAEDAQAIAAGLQAAGNEMDAVLHALSGGYIPAGPGGDAVCGGRALLPTGRSIYGVQQDKAPTPAAYRRGAQAAENLLALYRAETGRLPEKAAVNMTSLDVVRTGGEQLGQFLALLGVKPVWSPDGRVDGLACIPLEELGRPRVDVTAHISSVMRDAWPDVLALMDRAVRLAAGQEEPDEWNYVRANSREIQGQTGGPGTGRIFGGQPGTYSSAVGLALKASAWKSEEDLAKYFLNASSYLYGEKEQGVHAPDAFAANIRQIDLTGDITLSRHTDAGSSSYSARVQGSYRMAAQALGSRRTIRQYMGESGSGQSIRIVPLADHVTRSIRETLLNSIWREQMMERGYEGAAELMKRMQQAFDTQCMCGSIPDRMLDEVVRSCLLDETMETFFKENNPYAREEAARRFLELDSRGKWRADPEVLGQLRRSYLQAEGDLEDGVSGEDEIQGGGVDIVSHQDMAVWKERLKETEEVVARWRRSGP